VIVLQSAHEEVLCLWVILSCTVYWWMFGICMYVYGLLALVIFVLYFCQFICCNSDQYSYVLHGNVISKSPWEYHANVIMIMFISMVIAW